MAGITLTNGTGPIIGQGFYPNTSQYAQNYLNVIHRHILPGVIYQGVRSARPTLKLILSKCSMPLKGGWAPITQTVAFQDFDPSPIQWVGMEGTFNIPPMSNPLMSMQFLPSLGLRPIEYLLTEAVMMDSPEVAVDVIEQRTASVFESLMDQLNTTIFSSMGTNAQQMMGLLDIVDNGTYQSTYGGLSRATYPQINSLIYDASTITGATPYQVIHRLLMSFLRDTNYTIPDVGITSFAVFDALTESMTSIERVNLNGSNEIETTRDWAVQAVSVDGVPIMPDNKITTNTIYFLNLKRLHFGTIPQLNFKLTPPADMQPKGQLGWVQNAMVAGQFFSLQPQAHFIGKNVTANTLL